MDAYVTVEASTGGKPSWRDVAASALMPVRRPRRSIGRRMGGRAVIKVRYNYSQARSSSCITGLISTQKGWDSLWVE
jgi:hypothetical protein